MTQSLENHQVRPTMSSIIQDAIQLKQKHKKG